MRLSFNLINIDKLPLLKFNQGRFVKLIIYDSTIMTYNKCTAQYVTNNNNHNNKKNIIMIVICYTILLIYFAIICNQK